MVKWSSSFRLLGISASPNSPPPQHPFPPLLRAKLHLWIDLPVFSKQPRFGEGDFLLMGVLGPMTSSHIDGVLPEAVVDLVHGKPQVVPLVWLIEQ